ncbi:MAG: hypothetical protein LIP06_13975 [Tannerellaceae bacterium]|nr:hypothetical protein [Tannerellaceae bacterium]
MKTRFLMLLVAYFSFVNFPVKATEPIISETGVGFLLSHDLFDRVAAEEEEIGMVNVGLDNPVESASASLNKATVNGCYDTWVTNLTPSSYRLSFSFDRNTMLRLADKEGKVPEGRYYIRVGVQGETGIFHIYLLFDPIKARQVLDEIDE